jgi:hypothetical protein
MRSGFEDVHRPSKLLRTRSCPGERPCACNCRTIRFAPVAAAALGVNGSDLHIKHRVSNSARTGCSASPLAVARARDSQQAAHSCNRKLAAVRVHPGVPHRDSLAKYAAASLTLRRPVSRQPTPFAVEPSTNRGCMRRLVRNRSSSLRMETKPSLSAIWLAMSVHALNNGARF